MAKLLGRRLEGLQRGAAIIEKARRPFVESLRQRVERIAEAGDSMMDRTQFIMITHNRKTMAIANRLYSVTMEEPGVSKLISIQLN